MLKERGLVDGLFLVRRKNETKCVLSMCTSSAKGTVVHHLLATTPTGFTLNAKPLAKRCARKLACPGRGTAWCGVAQYSTCADIA